MWKPKNLDIFDTTKISPKLRRHHYLKLRNLQLVLMESRQRLFKYATSDTIAAAVAPNVPLPPQTEAEIRDLDCEIPPVEQDSGEVDKDSLFATVPRQRIYQQYETRLENTWFEAVTVSVDFVPWSLEDERQPDFATDSMSNLQKVTTDSANVLHDIDLASQDSDDSSDDAELDEEGMHNPSSEINEQEAITEAPTLPDPATPEHALNTSYDSYYAMELLSHVDQIDQSDWPIDDPRRYLSVVQLTRFEKEVADVKRALLVLEKTFDDIQQNNLSRCSRYLKRASFPDSCISRLRSRGLGSPLRVVTHVDEEWCAEDSWDVQPKAAVRDMIIDWRRSVFGVDTTDTSGTGPKFISKVDDSIW